MKKVKCYLRGAYGTGNLGDDLLFVSSYNYLKEWFCKEDIAVGVYDDSIAKLLMPDINSYPLYKSVDCDICFLGGGGQYFSFNPLGTSAPKKYSKIKFFLSNPGSIFYYIGKKLNGRWKAKCSIGFCIGVGPFENKTDVLYKYANKELPDFEYISVRDAQSKKLVDSLFSLDAYQFTDPIFDYSRWLPKDFSKVKPSAKVSKIGVVVRGWKHDSEKNKYIEKLVDSVAKLKSSGYEPVLFSFHEKDDLGIISYINKCNLNLHVWNPRVWSLKNYLEKLSSCDLIITTRAHGAIVSSVLEVPSVIINLEPKLANIHKMLSQSSMLIDIDSICNINTLRECIDTYKSSLSNYKQFLAEDVERNRLNASLAYDHVSSFISKKGVR